MKPLTKEQFETIGKWLFDYIQVVTVYNDFVDNFGNTIEDQEPKAPELWQWQLCPKCHGNKLATFFPRATTMRKSISYDCPVCEGEGKLKIPQSPVDMGQIKDLINEATKGQPNQIASFFTEENRKLYALKMHGKYKSDHNQIYNDEHRKLIYSKGREGAIMETWDVLKEMAKQKTPNQ